MASHLRQVLDRFADQRTPTSLSRIAHDMGIEPGMLQGMIEYWVRKGRLREVTSGGETCNTCGIQSACPFIVAMPRYYEFVSEDQPGNALLCQCDGGCSH
jgi:hypothetical protein